MGEVYKARDTRLDRSVAIKVLPEHIAKREDLRTRFEREAPTVASLNHPHICVLFDIGQQDDADYMVMECLEGETLAVRIQRGALPLDLALKLAIQTADALDRAHRNGVVHRDMKPSNLMLTRDGVKVLDFGLAMTAHGPNDATLTALTTSGALLGTPQYMSPEQWEGKQADERSDVFGFGCVVYEMVTGRRAFERQSGRGPDPPPMSASKALQELVSVCLAKDPEERWQSMRDVLLQLRSIARAPREDVIPASGTRRWRWIAAGIGLLSALAGWRTRPNPFTLIRYPSTRRTELSFYQAAVLSRPTGPCWHLLPGPMARRNSGCGGWIHQRRVRFLTLKTLLIRSGRQIAVTSGSSPAIS